MYSWNNVRTVCAILLLIPIVHLAYLVSRDALETLDASPRVWEREMNEYVNRDRDQRTPRRPIVVVGGERVKLWRGLEDVLAPRPVLMRGLGDATVNDILYYYDRLVAYYNPDVLVVLPGNSEFHIRDAKSPRELLASVRALAEVDEDQRGNRRLYIFAPLKTPLFSADHAKIEEASLLLRQWARQYERITILDANQLLSSREGRVKPDYFRNDGVNLNEHGYLRLSVLLQSQLERDAARRAAAAAP